MNANATNSRLETLTAFFTAASAVIVVAVGLTALGVMTSYMVSAVASDDAKLAIASTALGVIGTVIGAYFGVKAATDSSKNAQAQSNAATDKLVAVAHAADPNDRGVREALGL